MNTRYKLVIFDWDGTLMDSAVKIVRCFQAAAADCGAPIPDTAAIHDIIGLGLREGVEAIFPSQDAAQQVRIIERYRDHFLELDKTEMPLFPGVVDGLKGLRARGFELAVATGKARRGLARVLAETSTGDLFRATRCADESASKPDPQMILDLLHETGTAPRDAVMVGDTVHDMQMARRAQVDALAVTYGVQPLERLRPEGPLACFNTFDQICEWLH